MGKPIFFLFVLFALASVTRAAIGPVADLHIVNGEVSPDGYTREAVLAGGTFPGPLITGKKGDRFQINVKNSLTNETMWKSTTVHFHGIFQHNSSWADGTAFVTQCPIASGDSFMYDFTVPDQAGTYWYHSHYMQQYCDGLRGPLVIYDPNDPFADMYDVDDESTVITLSEWYHTAVLLQPVLAPTPDSILINGRSPALIGEPANLTIFTVKQGLRYRFRLISISCDPNFTFSIDDHNMTIIETDGVNTQPLVVDSIQIFAGQRYSFVLSADQPVDSYWVRVVPSAGLMGIAILRYEGAPEDDPTTTQLPSAIPLLETNLHPYQNAKAPGGPMADDVDVNLNLVFMTMGRGFGANNFSFIPPTVPVLLQILSGHYAAQDLLPAGNVYTLPPNKVIQISMPGGVVGAPHPLHLHGHTFSVVRSAGSTSYNYDNPIQRDVVSIGSWGDNTTIRFETNNPGPWLLHCHIDRHLQAGFAVVMAEAPSAIADTAPSAWDQLCPIYDQLSSGDL